MIYIYILSQFVSVMYTSNKYPRLDNITDAYLWYYRLDHINKNMINRLTKEKIFNINDCKSLPICESYFFEKMTKSSFTRKGEWASDVLSLVYTDVCGLINTSARGGYNYFITFTDDLSRYGYIYFMKYKYESFEMFKWFHNEVEK